MKSKIQQIIEREGLTNGQFAKLVGIQPSAVTHLVSKDNRKPSFDLTRKILSRFPQYDPYWFLEIDETADPLRSEYRTSVADTTATSSPTLFDSDTNSEDRSQVAPVMQAEANDSMQKEKPLISATNGDKRGSFVVVFYDDGSCERFSMR
ncbi:MAG: helix-turn-helix transcriptional regulator [Rikenellaceae bacterium]